ncbi:MAG: DnaJ domain-containing protein [Cytophagales bacterium]|nr:DnaJ domain-containing protein [Cytophagales bacterium]
MKNYYEILGVDHDAGKQEIKKAYYKLAKQWHPDVVPHPKKKEAEEKFKKISEAYHVLTNARSQYDSGYVSDDIFKDLDKQWEEMYASFQNIQDMFEEFSENMEAHFVAFEIKMSMVLRFFMAFSCVSLSFLVIEKINTTIFWVLCIVLSSIVIGYLLALAIELVMFKELKIKPGKEIYWIKSVILKRFKRKKNKSTSITKRHSEYNSGKYSE